MPRIAIGIPSFCEADSIAHVAATADDGLTRLFAAEDCVIVNADGHSPDGTATAFRATSTQCPKVSLDITSAQPGKGANVVAFLEYCAENGIEAAAILDADVTSITPGWIASLIQPAAARQAAMVFPLYRRHRFDGATTNLFAYPVISALCGSSIRQPIGGDFGLGRDLIHLALKTPVPTAALGYGIDIFLTTLALGSGLPVTQVPLGRKIHKPSHPRRNLIFTQVAAALLDTLRHLTVSGAWRPAGGGPKPDPSASIDDAAHTPIKPDTKQRAGEARRELSASLPSHDWADPGVMRSLAQGESLGAERWAELLACWTSTGLADRPICALEHSRQLLPLYFLRMDAFWQEIDGLDSAAVEDCVSRSVPLLSTNLGTLIK